MVKPLNRINVKMKIFTIDARKKNRNLFLLKQMHSIFFLHWHKLESTVSVRIN